MLRQAIFHYTFSAVSWPKFLRKKIEVICPFLPSETESGLVDIIHS